MIVCSQLQHTYSAVFYYYCGFRFTMCIKSIKFCSAVSYCLRRYPTKTPGQTPLGHNPPCLLPSVNRLESGARLVGRIGSGVRVSVSFQQKYPPGSVLRCPTAAENGRYDQGGLTSLRLRRITSNPSQTLRRPLVRTTDDGRRGECSTLAAVRRGFVFHTSRLVRLTTL